jgi:hypothetical protein
VPAAPDPAAPITDRERARAELLRPQGDALKAQAWALVALVDAVEAQTKVIAATAIVAGADSTFVDLPDHVMDAVRVVEAAL